MGNGYYQMFSLTDKNILICCNLKKERLILFNFFDNKESEMIHTAIEIGTCRSLLKSEQIDYFIIECSQDLINSPSQLGDLISGYSTMKVVLVINQEFIIQDSVYQQFDQMVDVILFDPLSNSEVEIKLSTLIMSQDSENNPRQSIKPTKPLIVEEPDNNTEELWNIFFHDSLQAKLLVNANSHKIIDVNEKLSLLLRQDKSTFIGQLWDQLDDQKNHPNYDRYIKEINSKDSTEFVIKITVDGIAKFFDCHYRMGVIDGEIVFIGSITPEKTEGISSEIYHHLKTIHNIDISSEKFPQLLEELRVYFDFKFITCFEYVNAQLQKPLISGDTAFVKNFLENTLALLMPIIKNNDEIKIDRDVDRTSEYIDILNINSLQSFCAFPVFQKNKTYGFIIAGGVNPIDNWQTTSVLLRSLANQCKFSLFHQNIVEQRTIEGLKDNLTGLPNRKAMTDKLSILIEKGIDADKYMSLLIIDFNKINFYNKSIGIELTNQLIVNLSKVVEKCIGPKGDIYRLSGDEFVVLLHPHLDKSLIESLTKELVMKLNNPILLSNGESIGIEFNMGISIFPDDGQTVSSMMKNADLAMYDAKLKGSNNYIIFKHSETGQALKQKTEMEENLKKAINEGHIKTYFQPKINALTEDIIGFEALVRWVDPEIGMINPGQFIPLAEETGLIIPIGEIVTKKSCDKVVEWQKKYGLNLTCSINLSVVQLMETSLPQKLENIINKSGVHPHNIDFEITETMSLDDVPNLVDSLNKIVSIGCTLSIDDFGTGHSSLDYVKRIPAKYIKVDQSFVKNIGLNPEDEAILDATINIAKRLNRELIAEGVETEEQREYLLERECEYFQGYLFARPMPEEDIEVLLKERVALMGTD